MSNDEWTALALSPARARQRPYLLVELWPRCRVLDHSVNHEDKRLILLRLAEHREERGYNGVITQQ